MAGLRFSKKRFWLDEKNYLEPSVLPMSDFWEISFLKKDNANTFADWASKILNKPVDVRVSSSGQVYVRMQAHEACKLAKKSEENNPEKQLKKAYWIDLDTNLETTISKQADSKEVEVYIDDEINAATFFSWAQSELGAESKLECQQANGKFRIILNPIEEMILEEKSSMNLAKRNLGPGAPGGL